MTARAMPPPPAAALCAPRRPPRPPRSSRRYPALCALVVAALTVANGSWVVHAASSLPSNSTGPFSLQPTPPNDQGVARVPIERLHNASFNASGSSGGQDETVTFESLLLPQNMVVPHLLDRRNETHGDTNATIAVERIPIEDASHDQRNVSSSEPPLIPSNASSLSSFTQLNTTAANATTVRDPVALVSSSSSSSAGDVSVGGNGTDETLPPPLADVPHGVPSPPTLVTAAAFDGSAQVSWEIPDDDGSDPILAYEVAWLDELLAKVAGTKIVGLSPQTSAVDPTTPSHANESVPTVATITSLTNGRSYTFKVRAKNINGFSTWSAKSLAVSPLHPPDLCGRVACSGHGTCFPLYQVAPSDDRRRLVNEEEEEAEEANARCICRPGFSPPDCSAKNEDTAFVWKVTEWGECHSGCGGGQRSRQAICWDVSRDAEALSEASCPVKKPSLTRICNGMECGSKLVSVRYQVETSFDEVLFSPEAWDAFELAFTTEVAAALLIPRTRLEITAIRRGSIVVFFQILPASRVGEPSLNDIVERLQSEMGNATSTLRSRGTFARRVETTGVKLSFSIADQTVAGGAEDISIVGLVGTVCVLCVFVALFGWFLRKRHERTMSQMATATSGRNVLDAKRSELKPMGIRTMA